MYMYISVYVYIDIGILYIYVYVYSDIGILYIHVYIYIYTYIYTENIFFSDGSIMY